MLQYTGYSIVSSIVTEAVLIDVPFETLSGLLLTKSYVYSHSCALFLNILNSWLWEILFSEKLFNTLLLSLNCTTASKASAVLDALWFLDGYSVLQMIFMNNSLAYVHLAIAPKMRLLLRLRLLQRSA